MKEAIEAQGVPHTEVDLIGKGSHYERMVERLQRLLAGETVWESLKAHPIRVIRYHSRSIRAKNHPNSKGLNANGKNVRESARIFAAIPNYHTVARAGAMVR
jgi:hypothetical protein